MDACLGHISSAGNRPKFGDESDLSPHHFRSSRHRLIGQLSPMGGVTVRDPETAVKVINSIHFPDAFRMTTWSFLLIFQGFKYGCSDGRCNIFWCIY